MKLPGRLRETTLGDLLGTLHRGRANGRLQLIETAGPSSGRTHFLELEDGKITAIEGEAQGPRLGELLELDIQARRARPDGQYDRIGDFLVNSGLVSQSQLRDALHQQLRLRLEALFDIRDAIILFRTPRPKLPDQTRPTPLSKDEFLDGRPRAKQRRTPARRGMICGQEGCREHALSVLGLPDGATSSDVQAAFRRLAQESHPDRFPGASAEQKRALLSRFASLSRAYHALTA
jgi:DnaJ-domain-containing protein 1